MRSETRPIVESDYIFEVKIPESLEQSNETVIPWKPLPTGILQYHHFCDRLRWALDAMEFTVVEALKI